MTQNIPETTHQIVELITYRLNIVPSFAPLASPTKLSVVKANPSTKNAEIYTKFNKIPFAANSKSPKFELRLINQICVATKEFHGWYSVFGTLMGAAGFAFLGYTEYQASLKKKE